MEQGSQPSRVRLINRRDYGDSGFPAESIVANYASNGPISEDGRVVERASDYAEKVRVFRVGLEKLSAGFSHTPA